MNIMNICDDNHDEIVFNGHRCPLCDKLDEIESLEKEVSALQEQLKNEIPQKIK